MCLHIILSPDSSCTINSSLGLQPVGLSYVFQTCQPHNHVNQLLKINFIHICICRHPIGSIFLHIYIPQNNTKETNKCLPLRKATGGSRVRGRRDIFVLYSLLYSLKVLADMYNICLKTPNSQDFKLTKVIFSVLLLI